jgi:hypothetical protein
LRKEFICSSNIYRLQKQASQQASKQTNKPEYLTAIKNLKSTGNTVAFIDSAVVNTAIWTEICLTLSFVATTFSSHSLLQLKLTANIHNDKEDTIHTTRDLNESLRQRISL